MVLREIIQGLKEVHSLGYVFRDLKPSNVVLTHDGRIKLCDYGLIGKLSEIDTSLCGTPEYCPPERLTEKRKKNPLTEAVDAWSLGVFAYELLMGCTPFQF